MPDIPINLSIEKDNTIRDVESYFAKLDNDSTSVNIRLPRHHKMTLFKDSWITSLIATASRNKILNIIDWDTLHDHEQIKKRFSKSLIGVTSAFMANEIRNVNKEKYDLNVHEIVEEIVYSQKGLIEDSESGKSFVFCSFDSNEEGLDSFSRPIALTFSSKQEFIRKLLDFKRERLDPQAHMGHAGAYLPFDYEEDWDLPSLIFELYENTNQHGKYDANDKIIKGVRTFSIKRHVSLNHSILLKQAKEFEELQKYIESISFKKDVCFYEISISDNGMGIIDRLMATRPELMQGPEFEQMSSCEKLNYIISKTLSSKMYPGSGLGLTTALRNLSKLKGFLSLRSGDQWVYFSRNKTSSEFKLKPIKNTESLSKISGTHYNILIPATN